MTTQLEKFQIVRTGIERIHELEPLWKALHKHHAEVAPELGQVRSPDESWRRRKANYEVWIKKKGSFIFLAENGDLVIGYVFVRMADASEIWQRDSIAEVETLSVLPEFRGAAVGSKLMDAVYSELKAQGIGNVTLQVAAANQKAITFYERQGFKSAIVHMLKRDL